MTVKTSYWHCLFWLKRHDHTSAECSCQPFYGFWSLITLTQDLVIYRSEILTVTIVPYIRAEDVKTQGFLTLISILQW